MVIGQSLSMTWPSMGWPLALTDLAFVLRAGVFLAPVGIYFITLGLLSTRPTTVVNGRLDFVQLSVVFFPIVAAVLLSLHRLGSPTLTAVAFLLIALLWWRLMPDARTNWVFYNMDAGHLDRLLAACANRLDMDVQRDGNDYRIGTELRVRVGHFRLLRISSLSCQPLSNAGREMSDRLVCELTRRRLPTTPWPSPIGAGLVGIGCAMIALPLFLIAGNLPEIAEVMRGWVG